MTVPVSARLPARVGSVRGPGVRAQGPRRRLATGVVRAESPKQGSGTTSLGPFKVESESAGEAPKDDTPSTSGQSPNPPSSKVWRSTLEVCAVGQSKLTARAGSARATRVYPGLRSRRMPSPPSARR